MAAVLFKICTVFVVFVACWFTKAEEKQAFSFTLADLQKELGFFGKCNGKTINYPQEKINEGFENVPACLTLVGIAGAKLDKPCVALCVAMSMEIVNGDGKYDIDVAAKPLLDSVAKTGADHNDADVVKIQVDALRRCGVRNQTFHLDKECKEALDFDQCIRTAAETDCGAKAE